MSNVRQHPYQSAPNTAFWSRAVARDWCAAEMVGVGANDFLIRKDDKVVSAGSCFAANIIPYLEQAHLNYLRTETTHPAFAELEPENLGYANFSAAYGNIYTARQLLQLLQRCLKTFAPVEDRWPVDGGDIVDPLRPGLRYRARSDREFDVLTAQHLAKTREAFARADVFVFTLGLTEGWISRLDGTVFPACPGTVAGSFDRERHAFKNFTVAEVAADLDEFVRLLRQLNPEVSIIFTVSPVPLVATATGNHVLSASIYSKSVLRVAAQQITQQHANTSYFPAYEIIAGPQAPESFFEKDRRNVSQAGVAAVMAAMLAHCEVEAPGDARIAAAAPPAPRGADGGAAAELSRLIAEAECEEAMADAEAITRRREGANGADRAIRRAETARFASAVRQPPLPAVEPDVAAPPLALTAAMAENATLRAECSALQAMLASERAAAGAELQRTIDQRDAAVGEATRWSAAAIAITADHNPLTVRAAGGANRWWGKIARRLADRYRTRPPPTVLADRAAAAGHWELAARYYRDALDRAPDDAQIWFKCGYALRAAGKVAAAEVASGKAFEHSGSRLPSRRDHRTSADN